MSAEEPALAVVELSSIARGLSVVDALVKRARVRLLMADPVTPGKLVIIFVGAVAEVEESLDAAREAAAGAELDVLLLPGVHDDLVEALADLTRPPVEGAIGVLEMTTVASTLRATDALLKAAEVKLVALHLARGIGGKGYVAFTGEHHFVEAALEAGDEAVAPEHRAGYELIARPHPELDWMLGRL